MKIGNLNIDNNVLLAPMAGVSDMPFRVMCKKEGAGLTYTEMVSAKGMFYNDQKTKSLLEIHEIEVPCAVQIFGSDSQILGQIAGQLSQFDIDIIDINMGCPTPKIVKNGEGSALMKNPRLVGEIVNTVVKSSDKPVTVKIRKGWDDSSVNAVEIAKIAEQNGASAITVHGRTREQFYSGNADWNIIKSVKEAVSIPVIGNGDVNSPEDAKAMFETTNCDGIMIGRAARGNPWIFRNIIHYLKTGELIKEPTIADRFNKIFEHYSFMLDTKGENIAVREMRKHISWYIRGLKNSNSIKDEINKYDSYQEVLNCLNNYKNYLESI